MCYYFGKQDKEVAKAFWPSKNVGFGEGRRGGLAYLARGVEVLTGQGLFYAPQEFPNRGNTMRPRKDTISSKAVLFSAAGANEGPVRQLIPPGRDGGCVRLVREILREGGEEMEQAGRRGRSWTPGPWSNPI